MMAYNGFHQLHYHDATNRAAQTSSSRYTSQQQPMPSTGHSLQHTTHTQGQSRYGWQSQSSERSGREDMAFGNGRWGPGQRQLPQDYPQQRQQQQQQQQHGSMNSVPSATLFQSPRQSQTSLNATALNNRVYEARTETTGKSVSGSKSSTPLSANRSHQRASLLTASVNNSVSSHAPRSSDFLANLTNPAEPPDPSHQAEQAPMYSGLPFQSTSSNSQREQDSSTCQPHVTTYPTSMPSSLPVVDTGEETVPYSISRPYPTFHQPTNRIQSGSTSGSSSYGTSHNRERSMNVGTHRDHHTYQKPPTPEVPLEPISSSGNPAVSQQQPMSTENYTAAVSRAPPMMRNSYQPTRPLSPDATGVANLLSNIRGQGHQPRLSEQGSDSNAVKTHNASPSPVQPNTATPVETPKYQYSQPSPTTNMPGFVDPSFIYDPYHEERRRAQAAEVDAERSRREEEANTAESWPAPPAAAQPEDSKTAADAHNIAVSALSVGAFAGNVEQNGDSEPQNQPQNQPQNIPKNKTENKAEKKQPKKQPKKKAPLSSNLTQAKKRGSRPRKSTASAAAEPTPHNNAIPPTQESRPSIASLLTSSHEQLPPQDMASEMKLMIDRMREFKTKDPSLFSKLWEDLKKNQPQAASGASGTQASESKQPNQPDQPGQRTPAPAEPSSEAQGSNQLPSSQNGPQKSNGPLPGPGNPPAKNRRGRPRKQAGTNSPASSKKQAVGQIPQGYQPVPPHGASPCPPNSLVNPSPNSANPHNGHSKKDSPSTSKMPATAHSTTPEVGPANISERPANSDASAGQPAPAKPSNTTSETIWPEEKQKSVAHEISRHLVTDPKNKDKDDPESLILAFINQKPSYGELCQMIESRGFVLNRGDLARHILRVIPDLNGNASRPPPPVQQPQQSQQPPTPSPSVNHAHPPIGSVQYNNTGHWSRPPTKPAHFTPAINKTQAPDSGLQTQPAYTVTPHNTPLSQGSDKPVSQTAPKLATPTVSTPPAQPCQPSSVNNSGKSSIPHILRDSPGLQDQPAPAPLRQSQGKVGTSPNANRLPKGYRVASLPPNAPAPNTKEAMARKRDFSDIVDLTQALSDDEDSQPVSKAPRSEDVSTSAAAPSTSTVFPSTATAVPSTFLPFSTTFSPFQDRIDSSTQAGRISEQIPKPSSKFDLSAFKRPEDISGSKESLRRHSGIVQPINKTEALRTSYYDPKTIARDILIAAGRHPTERPLNAHLSKLQETFSFVDNSSDLGTFRWDLVDPGGPACPNVEPVPVLTHPPNLSKPEPRSSVSQQQKQPDNLNAELSRDSKKRASSGSNTKTHRSLHRSSNLHISQTVGDSTGDEATPTRRKENIVQDSSNLTISAPPISEPRKMRGRPRKTDARRTTLPSTVAAKSSNKIEVAVPMRQPQLQYSVYRCKWQECESKLHNLETLQKHFQKVHGDCESGRKHLCLWSNCDTEENALPSRFTSAELYDHVQKAHIEPMAWNLGEGPSVTRNDDLDLEKVLNDSDGRIITPATGTQGTRDSLLLPAGSVPIRAFHKARGNTSEHARAKEMLRALQWKKYRVGFGLDRAGCTTANFKRLPAVGGPDNVFQFVDDEKDHLSTA